MPFRQDPTEGRALLTGGTGGAATLANEFPCSYHPRRGNGEIFTKFERLLERCGLGRDGGEQQHIIIPADATPPLKHATGRGVDRGHAIPINVHFREIPPWTQSDEKVRVFVLHRFPKLTSKEKKHRRRSQHRASHTVALIYLWFRAMLPVAEIAELLGDEESHILQAAMDVRTHGFDGFVFTCKCGSGPIRNQYGLTERGKRLAAATA